MKKLSAVIVDDEKSSIVTLEWLLQDFKDKITVAGSFQDPREAIGFIKTHKPDLLFLDIQMPNLTGFDLLEAVDGFFEQVVFITAYDDFAIKAFEVSAVDYLLKPIDADLLKKCIDKATHFFARDVFKEQLEILMKKLNQNKVIDKIALPTMEGLMFVKPSQIVYCKSDSNYTHVVMLNKEELLISKTLKEIEQIIQNDNFFRVHHSYLVNLNYLSKYYKGKNAYVVMESGQQIPVSRNKKNDFLDNL